MTYISTKEFYTEVNRGNVPGMSTAFVGGLSGGITNTEYRDVSPLSTPQTENPFPVSAGTWEIFSDSADDSAGGTGVRKITLAALDEDYNFKLTVVSMNGLTKVTIPGTHLRVRGAIINITDSSAAGSGRVNKGTVTIQEAGGGKVLAKMLPGVGSLVTGTYTVPAGRVARLIDFTFAPSKNNEVQWRTAISVEGGPEISGGGLKHYQVPQYLTVFSPLALDEKVDFRILARSDNIGPVNYGFIVNFLVIDTGIIQSASMSMLDTMFQGFI